MTNMNKEYILMTWYDYKGFRETGEGDYYETREAYRHFDTQDDMLQSLKKNIRFEGGGKTPYKTVKEFCDAFDFIVYERII